MRGQGFDVPPDDNGGACPEVRPSPPHRAVPRSTSGEMFLFTQTRVCPALPGGGHGDPSAFRPAPRLTAWAGVLGDRVKLLSSHGDVGYG